MYNNTGKLVYQWLRQYDEATGLPTGLRKPNDPGDKDYVLPVDDFTACPLPYSWEPVDPFCIRTARTCAPGYTLSSDGAVCIKMEEVAAIPPTGAGVFKVVASTNGDYSSYGTRIFEEGYDTNGVGASTTINATNAFWKNIPGDTVSGPLNRCGVYGDNNNDGIPDKIADQWIGFVTVVNLSADESVYVGIAGDNAARISVTNIAATNKIIVEQVFVNTPPENFRYWNIYKINLKAGPNYIKLEGIDDGAISASFGAEVYRNTREQILGASSYANLNLLFSTKDARGGSFQTGTTGGFSCPDGYVLDPNNGNPLCRKISTLEPIQNNTGEKGWQNRRRLINNVPDGLVEPNTSGTGPGPYFPPVRDTSTCPVTVAELSPFDFCVVRYVWTPDAGTDLDTFTRLVNTGTPYDDQWIGYHLAPVDSKIPANTAGADAYLWWASDNTNSGVEAVLLNYKNFIRDFASGPDTIEVRMNAVWFGAIGNGRISIQLTTYLGGTMAAGSNFDFINTGGAVVDNVTLTATVNRSSQNADIAFSNYVAVVRYNKSTKQAKIQIV